MCLPKLTAVLVLMGWAQCKLLPCLSELGNGATLAYLGFSTDVEFKKKKFAVHGQHQFYGYVKQILSSVEEPLYHPFWGHYDLWGIFLIQGWPMLTDLWSSHTFHKGQSKCGFGWQGLVKDGSGDWLNFVILVYGATIQGFLTGLTKGTKMVSHPVSPCFAWALTNRLHLLRRVAQSVAQLVYSYRTPSFWLSWKRERNSFRFWIF